jgi:putative ABC transport system ATP-binding protein
MSLIKISNLKKSYKIGNQDILALRGIDLEVKPGEFVAIMGASGSGKSTLLNLLSGLDHPDNGSVVIDGTNISSLSQDRMAEFRLEYMGYIFQQFHLIPILNAKENVALPMKLNGDIDEKRIEKILGKVGLLERINNLPTQLSGGEQQRVAIARALANDPVIIFADEPTGNLDSKTASNIMELLSDLNKKENHTIIMVTHDQESASYASRIVHLKDGLIEKEEVKNGKVKA